MRKGDNGEEKREKTGGKKKIMMKIVATNVIASRPPERRPTATLTARAKKTTEIVATNVVANLLILTSITTMAFPDITIAPECMGTLSITPYTITR